MQINWKQNLGLKIISVVIAVILWMYIQMTQNPEIDYVFPQIPIEYTNTSALEDSKLYILNEEGFKADITLRCQRWALNDLTNGDFTVYVDLSEIRSHGQAELKVKVRLSSDKVIVSQISPSYINMDIDQIVTEEKPLKLYLSGKVRDGYYTNEKMIVPDAEFVSVTGPKTYIDNVKDAIVSVDISTKTADFNEENPVLLVDSSDSVITHSSLSLLSDKVNVSGMVYTKKILPITLTNIPEGLTYEIRPASVEVAAPKAEIDLLEFLQASFADENLEAGDSRKLKLNIPQNMILLTDTEPVLEIKSIEGGD